MFFQTKKKSLLKRLWRARMLNTLHPNKAPALMDTENGGGSVFLECCASNNDSDHGQNDPWYRFFLAFVGRLKDKQLETLKLAIETDCCSRPKGSTPIKSGATSTDCILVPKENIYDIPAHVVACRMWRWADLIHPEELRPNPWCRSKTDPVYICCNPTHWSRLAPEMSDFSFVNELRQETPPPPYKSIAKERLKYEDDNNGIILQDIRNHQTQSYNNIECFQRQNQIHNAISMSTNGEGPMSNTIWCKLAYWELRERVGDPFLVDKPTVNIFADQIQQSGRGGDDESCLCLATLAQERRTQPVPETVLNTRQKIGLGIAISNETDGVWLYNRSSVPVFLHSPTLSNGVAASIPHVLKVQPGFCLKAYDPNRAAFFDTSNNFWPGSIACVQQGPIDVHSLRISFAKGWGGVREDPQERREQKKSYRRIDVTGCPCWLEVMLSPCR